MSRDANVDEDTKAKHKRGVALYVLLCSLFPLIIPSLVSAAVFLLSDIDKHRTVKASTKYAVIEYPNRTHSVDEYFTAKGKLLKVESTQKVFLATSVDDMYWPKLDITHQKHWEINLTASGEAGYQYTIGIIAVDSKGASTIEQWFNRGEETGSYPPLQKLSGLKLLAQSKVIRK